MADARAYHVYVIELDREACEQHQCPARNGSAPVYVGQSAVSPKTRFAQHKDGYKSSRVVHKFGKKLSPGLSDGYGPYGTREEALRAEATLAETLKRQGFCVFGGH